MLDGSSYNIGPAYTEDIGVAHGFTPLNIPYTGLYGGCYGGFIGGGISPMPRDSMILRPPLSHDKVDISRKEKDKRIWKNVFSVAALGTLCVLGYKFGKSAISKIANGIKNLFKKKP